MKMIYYSKEGRGDHVLAEQNEDKSWHVPGRHGQLSSFEFRSLWTDEPPCPYRFHDSRGDEAPDPNAMVRSGSHTLEWCSTVDEVRSLEASVPGVQFLEPDFGFIYRDLPVYFAKRGPIEEFEEIPAVGADLPLVAIVPSRSSD